VLPRPIPLERMEPVAGRNLQVVEARSGVCWSPNVLITAQVQTVLRISNARRRNPCSPAEISLFSDSGNSAARTSRRGRIVDSGLTGRPGSERSPCIFSEIRDFSPETGREAGGRASSLGRTPPPILGSRPAARSRQIGAGGSPRWP
jgi:hypothetical protein